MITVEPIGGLGNRMRAVESGIALGRELGCAVRVIWTRTPDFGCAFRALFSPIAGVPVIERGRWQNRALRRLELRLGCYSRDIRQAEMDRLRAGARDREQPVPGGPLFDFRALRSERSTLLVTCDGFHDFAGGFAHFVPVDALRQAVAAQRARFGPRTLGVHVRRTDHLARLRSPLEAFVERMESERAAQPDTSFYLATDAPEVEAELRRRFGADVLSRPGCLDRSRPAAASDAVIDLWTLAGTEKILGSYFSSFSETAASVGGIPLEIIEGAR